MNKTDTGPVLVELLSLFLLQGFLSWGAASIALRTLDSVVLRRETQKYSIVNMNVNILSNCLH